MREPELDYLRFTSILLVFMSHTAIFINIYPIQNFIVGIGSGNEVAVFYVISGYLAFATYRDTSWKEYYKCIFRSSGKLITLKTVSPFLDVR